MALVPSIYRKYITRIKPGFEHVAPGITSRFEIFTDDTFREMKISEVLEYLKLGLILVRSIRVGSNLFPVRQREAVSKLDT